ncbi:MAG: DsbA family protein [Nannocystaceae bacterium]|nr:DsbA family protein [Nannocystaceae bacterium]
MSAATLRFHYDVVCPFAAIAAHGIEAFAAAHGLTVQWCPVLLGGLLRHFGAPDDPNAVQSAARAANTRRDIVLQAALHGLRFAVPREHPRRTLAAMRLVVAAPPDSRPALSLALMDAYWRDGLDLADEAVLAPIAQAFGVACSRIHDDDVKAELRARTDAAAAAGVFGVPTLLWGEQRIWGHDRLPLLSRALGRAVDPAAPIRTGVPPQPPAQLRFFHDVASPFSYLASTQIERVCAAAGATLQRAPILLGALFRDIGTADVPMFTMHPAKQAWVRQDLDAWAAAWGVPLRFPTQFPIRSVLPQRVCLAEPAATAAIDRAAWAQDVPVAERDALGEVLQRAGFDARELLARAESQAIKDALRAHTEAARLAGACGVPSMLVSVGAAAPRLVWGQDRLATVASLLAGFVPPAVDPAP